MLNLISTGKVTLALIVIILLLSGAFATTVVIYKSKVKSLEIDLKEEQLQGVLLQDSLTSANNAIDEQNKEIEKVRLDYEKARQILQQELDNITKEKNELIVKAEKSLLQDNSCENKLSIINNTQVEYLNE